MVARPGGGALTFAVLVQMERPSRPVGRMLRIGRVAGFAAVLSGALAAGLGASDVSASGVALVKPAAAQEGAAGPTSLAGSYLSGRHAQRVDDWRAAAAFIKGALERDAGNVDLLRRAFVLQLGAGEMAAALASARELLQREAGAQLATLFLTAEDMRAGRVDEAARRVEAMPREGMAQYLQPLLAAWTEMARRQPERAISALAPLEQAAGLRPLMQLHAGLIHELSGNADAAAKAYAAALEAGAPLRVVQVVNGFHRRTGRTAVADEVVARFLATNPDNALFDPADTRPVVGNAVEGMAEALFNLAVALDQEGADETALLYGRIALHLRPEFGMARLVIGDVLTQRRRYDEAMTEYAQVKGDAPLSWVARMRTADALNAQKKHDEALALLAAMAEERKDRPDALTRMGDIQRQTERFVDALASYDRAMERIGTPEPRHWPILYARGIAGERSGNWARAEQDFLKALELSPEQPYVLNYLGYTWIDRGENLERGKQMVERAVQLRPNDGHIVDSLGWAYFKLGDLEQAIKHLERAVELQPLDATINDHLGDAYWQIGRHQEARFQWNRALLKAEEPKQIAEIKTKLERELPRRLAAGAQRNGGPSK